jgi:hypothetical protein
MINILFHLKVHFREENNGKRGRKFRRLVRATMVDAFSGQAVATTVAKQNPIDRYDIFEGKKQALAKMIGLYPELMRVDFYDKFLISEKRKPQPPDTLLVLPQE